MKFRVPGLALALLILLSVLAMAQERPTLERLEASICVQTDADKLGYRPVFCAPRCDCLLKTNLPDAASCEQQPSGDVRVAFRREFDAYCTGSCFLTATPTFGICLFDFDCVGSCNFLNCAPADISATLLCSTDADCDAADGYACNEIDPTNLPGVKACQSTSCSTSGMCDTGVEATYQEGVFGFAPAGDLAPLWCAVESTWISSTDAAACVSGVEAALGAGACVICGDGNVDPGEQCDDGNLTPGDGCAADCTNEP